MSIYFVRDIKPYERNSNMRPVLDRQSYLNFAGDTSLKIVREYREKYAHIDRVLDVNPDILWLVHEDLERLSTSTAGREARYTTENLFRALVVHQVERTALRETVVRIAESSTLQHFVRLGNRPVMDYSFLDRALKAITPETWQAVNAELATYAAGAGGMDVSEVRVDSTVVEANIHYPTDSSLLWDSYRVLSRLLRAVRDERPGLCPHRFHDKKAKTDLVYLARYLRSRSAIRQRSVKRHYRRLIEHVRRLQTIAGPLCKTLRESGDLTLTGLANELSHYLPLTRTVCSTAERAALKGETVPARDRIFSIFEEHTELIKRGKSSKPVEFGHAVWLSQNRAKFITDYEVLERTIPDTDLLEPIMNRHEGLFGSYPNAVAGDTGFRSGTDEMNRIEANIETVAVPGRGRDRRSIDKHWHHFRAGIEGSISALKRGFRISVCMYRSFKTFAAAVGMAVFCHNLIKLKPEPASP